MKRFLSILAAIMLVVAVASPVRVLAADSAKVYFTFSDGEGKIVRVCDTVTVTDVDEDGALTILDAFYCAHEQNYDGGAAAGFETVSSDYGPFITKLWGIENGGNFGYYLNNAMAMGVTDPVKDGDTIKAYAFRDPVTFADVYTYFDNNKLESTEGEEVEVTLSGVGFDESYNPVSTPVEGAVIVIDDKDTEFVTDAEGKATITFDGTGEHVVSARSDSQVLVPPVLVVNVNPDETAQAPILIAPKPENLAETGASAVMFYVVGSLAAAGAAFAGKRRNEK